ncbi:MAG TPA: hypothetical protein VGL81_32880 [Polyangiaceae bacterium]|jgi:hypothetical protein
MHLRGVILSFVTDAQRRARAVFLRTEAPVKASIRLVFPSAVVLLSLLSSGCAAGASGGLHAPRLVRERMVFADEGTVRTAGSLATTLEHRAERARVRVMWRVNAIR